MSDKSDKDLEDHKVELADEFKGMRGHEIVKKVREKRKLDLD